MSIVTLRVLQRFLSLILAPTPFADLFSSEFPFVVDILAAFVVPLAAGSLTPTHTITAAEEDSQEPLAVANIAETIHRFVTPPTSAIAPPTLAVPVTANLTIPAISSDEDYEDLLSISIPDEEDDHFWEFDSDSSPPTLTVPVAANLTIPAIPSDEDYEDLLSISIPDEEDQFWEFDSDSSQPTLAVPVTANLTPSDEDYEDLLSVSIPDDEDDGFWELDFDSGSDIFSAPSSVTSDDMAEEPKALFTSPTLTITAAEEDSQEPLAVANVAETCHLPVAAPTSAITPPSIAVLFTANLITPAITTPSDEDYEDLLSVSIPDDEDKDFWELDSDSGSDISSAPSSVTSDDMAEELKALFTSPTFTITAEEDSQEPLAVANVAKTIRLFVTPPTSAFTPPSLAVPVTANLTTPAISDEDSEYLLSVPIPGEEDDHFWELDSAITPPALAVPVTGNLATPAITAPSDEDYEDLLSVYIPDEENDHFWELDSDSGSVTPPTSTITPLSLASPFTANLTAPAIIIPSDEDYEDLLSVSIPDEEDDQFWGLDSDSGSDISSTPSSVTSDDIAGEPKAFFTFHANAPIEHTQLYPGGDNRVHHGGEDSSSRETDVPALHTARTPFTPAAPSIPCRV